MAITFTPRLTKPDRSNKYYNAPNPFEQNWNISMWNGGNCTAYAWGRFHEVMGGSVTDAAGYWLPTYNAEDWWGAVKGYETGSTPRLGAVLCLRDGPYSGVGHVAVVEKINADGTIVTSESGYRSFIWMTKTRKPPYYNSEGYGFQGFIYPRGITASTQVSSVGGNQIVNAPEVFLTEARKHIGPEGHAWVKRMTNIGEAAWCAATICAIAKAVGYAGIILPQPGWGYYCVDQVARYAESKGGTYIKGPNRGNDVIPQPGDLILFDWENSYTTKYGADHIGVVEKVDGGTVTTIEGNAGNQYKRRTFNYKWKRISYYMRPNWSLVGGVGYASGTQFQPLYSTKSTRADAILRDVGYMSTTGKISTSKSSMGLSVVNYTSMIGSIVDSLGGSSSATSSDADTSGITNSTARGIIDFLINKGCTPAGACGVAGNIQGESNFNLGAVGDNGTSFGLCQWHNERGAAMKAMAGVNWNHNLEGQLNYLWKELTSGYSSLTSFLKSNSNTEADCRKAADRFVREFERPADPNGESVKRQKYAVNLWSKLKVVTSTPTTASTVSGKAIKKTVTIPSSLKQTGLISDYTGIERT